MIDIKNALKVLPIVLCLALTNQVKAQIVAGSVYAEPTTINFSIKDQETGFGISNAKIKVVTPTSKIVSLDVNSKGKLNFKAAEGKYTFLISADGYKALETYFMAGESEAIEAEINLDPIRDSRTTLNAQTSDENKLTNVSIIQGYVSDEETGKPLSGVEIKVGNYNTTTNKEGLFTVSVPASPIVQNITPKSTVIEFYKSGYQSHIKKNFYLIPDKYTLKVSLLPLGVDATNSQKKQIITEVQKHGIFDRTEEDETQRYLEGGNSTLRDIAPLASVNIPSSIRVGINCECKSCDNVKVMSLEAYTQSGLDDEWISSWRANSLKAGAIAYRSYGAWHVSHPVSSQFDIAATTCNQMWVSGVVQSAKDAAIATSGRVLVKNGSLYRAEYSAENNNAGCGNGYAGTGSSWPCISDMRCEGSSKNGHGRGMCQWGSQRWSSDKDYMWILSHYYTPGGVSVSDNCPGSLSLTSTIGEGTYKSSGSITASASLASNADVVLDAGSTVVLNIGFSASYANGNSFTAKLGGCDADRAASIDESLTAEPGLMTSIEEEFKIYPNPSSTGQVIIEYPVSTKGSTSVTIFNLMGKEVRSFPENGEKLNGRQSMEANTSGIPPGIYSVVITSPEGKKSMPLVIK